MIQILPVNRIAKEKIINTAYKYFLGFSEDGLIVIKLVNGEYELVEMILSGTKSNGLVASCPDEDSFLDTIILIKGIILSGRNPLEVIDFDNKGVF